MVVDTRRPIDTISCGALYGLSQNDQYCGVSNITCVPNTVNDMACRIISFTPLTDVG